MDVFPPTGCSCYAPRGTTNSVALSAFSEPGDNLLVHVYLCAESERTGRFLTAIMETLLLSGILFWIYILICILINHLVQFKKRAGLALVFSVIMSLQSNDRLFNLLGRGLD